MIRVGGWVGGWRRRRRRRNLPDLMGERPFLRGATSCWRLSMGGWVGGWVDGWFT